MITLGFGLEKYSDFLIELKMVLYVTNGLKKYWSYLTGFGFTLSVYDRLALDLRNTQHEDYLAGPGLILLNTGIGLINQPNRDVVTKV